ncbi:Aminoacylase-1A, partial [Orchesella cincta]
MMAHENPAVTRFREYVRIKSVQPEPDYGSCIEWVKGQAKEIDLEFDLINFQQKPGFAVLLTWKGSDTSLKSLMLNSHMDVVPVDVSKWSHDPFAAFKDDNGKIFGRGTQDMKSVGIQYLEAIRNLKAQDFVPQRTIHITFVPDEEIGGTNGMAKFVETDEFRQLNVGFELDEGGPCPTEEFGLFYGERALWQIKITIKGNTGHALNFVEGTCVEKLQKLMNGFLTLREQEKEKLSDGDISRLGFSSTLNTYPMDYTGNPIHYILIWHYDWNYWSLLWPSPTQRHLSRTPLPFTQRFFRGFCLFRRGRVSQPANHVLFLVHTQTTTASCSTVSVQRAIAFDPRHGAPPGRARSRSLDLNPLPQTPGGLAPEWRVWGPFY